MPYEIEFLPSGGDLEPGGMNRFSAPAAVAAQLDGNQLRSLIANVIAYARGEAFGRVPGAPDELLQIVRTAMIDPSIPAEAVEIAREMLQNRASNGNLRALRAVAVLEGREADVAEIDARPTTVDFRGNRRLVEVEEMLLGFSDGTDMRRINLTYFELADAIINGERERINERAISLARERLTRAAENGNRTAAQLVAIVVQAETAAS